MQDYKELLAKEYNLDKRVINLIVDHPFKFIRDLILSSDSRPFLLHGVGTFHIKKGKTKYVFCLNIYLRIIGYSNYDKDIESILVEEGLYNKDIEIDDILLDLVSDFDIGKLNIINEKLKYRKKQNRSISKQQKL